MKISVIIPVYNAEKYLPQALDSVLAQTFTDYECICVNDGSTDGSAAILTRYEQMFREAGRSMRIVTKVNGGEGSARNAGLAVAQGELIGWLDADDVYASNRLAEVVRIAEMEHPDLIRLTSHMSEEMPAGFLDGKATGSGYHLLTNAKDVAIWCWDTFAARGTVWNWYAKRRILQGLSFREEMRIKTDGAFSFSLVPRLKKVCYEEHPSLFYRVIPSSAIHGGLREGDTSRCLKAILDAWNEQREFAEQINALDELCSVLKRTADNDIVDWASRMRNKTPEEIVSVRHAYLALEKSGALSAGWQLTNRYRLAFPFYQWFGWIWPVYAVNRVFASLGKLLRQVRGD